MCEAEGEASHISSQTTKFCHVYSGACTRDVEALQEKEMVWNVVYHHITNFSSQVFIFTIEIVNRQIQVSHLGYLLFITLHLHTIKLNL